MPPEENEPNPTREHSFDELARGLASGTISRRRLLGWLGATLVATALSVIPRVAPAQDGGAEAKAGGTTVRDVRAKARASGVEAKAGGAEAGARPARPGECQSGQFVELESIYSWNPSEGCCHETWVYECNPFLRIVLEINVLRSCDPDLNVSQCLDLAVADDLPIDISPV